MKWVKGRSLIVIVVDWFGKTKITVIIVSDFKVQSVDIKYLLIP